MTMRWPAKLRSFAFHGKGETQYDNVHVGINSRLDTMQAAILIEKLAILEDEMVARQEVAAALRRRSRRHRQGRRSLRRQPLGLGAICHRDAEARRAEGASQAKRAFRSVIYYVKPLHPQIAYRDYPRTPTGLPVSEELPERILCLPMHPYLSEADQDRIIETIRNFIGRTPSQIAAE